MVFPPANLIQALMNQSFVLGKDFSRIAEGELIISPQVEVFIHSII
ncbi:hypothetical protein AM1_A0365 (plasmid) [Acaryochloris marina MBIC11017]|uniref:Uncharacterized protein n=1 Tax=Acaryochloris marina (strain MBIC 11017) TaxID=329726 RepID=A8ZL15_ACAM1|nr:hypothetical protein AM1_A0365 [Acaryochloris marina MBIC11017]